MCVRGINKTKLTTKFTIISQLHSICQFPRTCTIYFILFYFLRIRKKEASG